MNKPTKELIKKQTLKMFKSEIAGLSDKILEMLSEEVDNFQLDLAYDAEDEKTADEYNDFAYKTVCRAVLEKLTE